MNCNPIAKARSFRLLSVTEVSKRPESGIKAYLFLHIVAASAISWHWLWISFFASLFQSSVKYWAKSVLARLSVSRTLWRRVNLSKYIAISCIPLNAFFIYGTQGLSRMANEIVHYYMGGRGPISLSKRWFVYYMAIYWKLYGPRAVYWKIYGPT